MDPRTQFRELCAKTASLPPEERAERLMDWVMQRIAAVRCALIPFEGGAAGVALVLRVRADDASRFEIEHIPRGIVQHVASTRQPLVRQAGEESDEIAPPVEQTAVRQRVASYLAVPVIFRGDLLAVCCVDRFDIRGRSSGASTRCSSRSPISWPSRC